MRAESVASASSGSPTARRSPSRTKGRGAHASHFFFPRDPSLVIPFHDWYPQHVTTGVGLPGGMIKQ